ncbi:hypothetical protein FAES_0170 [Fibrella aestuarina BUZ 2]|uniref:Uncharacterized protein n=1 Tax=Fibrella aestuarina BUZ 2 TaxID=1166018 RepID=I0K231_9BACT|nr:hypothetical protein FAES_0170 [Fibrella aestuarina BUZ 2]
MPKTKTAVSGRFKGYSGTLPVRKWTAAVRP